jgi:hypothetical protein
MVCAARWNLNIRGEKLRVCQCLRRDMFVVAKEKGELEEECECECELFVASLEMVLSALGQPLFCRGFEGFNPIVTTTTATLNQLSSKNDANKDKAN